MAKEKKPSIYSDRGTIGSADELDEYGVWVKSEPQDLSSEEDGMPDLNAELSGEEDMDLEIPEIEDLPDFGSFDEKTVDDFSLTELPTDDFAIPDIESDSEIETDKLSFSDNGGIDDLGLDGLTEEAVDDSLDIPDLDESPDSELDISMELTDLDEPALEDNLDFPEIEDQENLSLDVDLPETENGDDLPGISQNDLSLDNSIDDLIENFDEGEEELPDISMDLDTDAVEEEYAPSFDEAQTETGFSTDSGSAAPSSSPDLSTQLLMKIAEELSSIRAELSSLKKEFSGIRAAAPAAETEEGGFFDKEDDEKISLTGDELNNILNTADFTEETGTDVTMELSEDDAGDADLLTVADIDTDSAGLDLPEDIDLPELTEEKEDEPIIQDLTTEDANYLADEPVEEEGAIDLEEAATDEADLTLDEIPLEEISVEDLSSEDISSEVLSSEDISQADILAEMESPVEESLPDDLSVNLDIEELSSAELSSAELSDVELADVDNTSDELDNLEIAAEDLSIEELSPEELSSEELEEPPAEAFAAEEPSAEELSMLELGAEDIETAETVLEELSPEPTEVEPVLEEDLEILAADEEPEDDFGILVVDEEPPSKKAEPAKESHEEAAVQKTAAADTKEISGIPKQLKQELKTVLSYMDQLLEALPDEKIEEFARSEHYDTYKKLFKELGIA